MKFSLKGAFEKVRNFFIGEVPTNATTASEFETISEMMKERGCNLELTFRPIFRLGYLEDIGFVTSEKTSVHEIGHAEGHLEDVFQIVTGRPLDRDAIKHYDKDHVAQIYNVPMMF